MTISTSDISFTLSGGSTNNNPDYSLGGDPSVHPVLNKRLFDNVSSAESVDGMVDYRCIYVNNDSFTDTLYNSSLSVLYTNPGDITIQLGFNIQNERQSIVITNGAFVTNGSFSLDYTDANGTYNIVVNYNANLATWASNFETAIRGVVNLEDVTVSPTLSGDDIIFTIEFVGVAGKRFHELLVLDTNYLVASLSTSILINRDLAGSPINTIAGEIDVDTTAPNGITFVNLASIGDLRPYDIIPVWFKRTVPAQTAPVENDGFTLRVTGDAVGS